MHPARLLRNRLLGATRRIIAPLRRWRNERTTPVIALTSVQRRLELLLGAMYDTPMRIVARDLGSMPAANDIVLPPSLPGGDDARARYQLLAIEQAARIARGTRASTPADALDADLYMVLEGAAVDAEIAGRAPGLLGTIYALRREELAARPRMHRLVPQQRAVEASLRELLSREAGAEVPGLPRTASAQESADVARALGERLREQTETRIRYRPLATVSLWDDALAMGRIGRAELMSLTDFQVAALGFTRSDEGDDGKAASRDGTSEMEADDDDGSGDATASADPGHSTAGGASVCPGDDDAGVAALSAREVESTPTAAARTGIRYPEWITRHQRLDADHTTVIPVDPSERDESWSRAALREHGPLVRKVRDHFAMLRSRRMRLRAQRSGDELDLDQCVDALVDVKLGRVPDDRLYQTTRATRHPLAIAILVDVSGSTNTILPDGRTVLDVERLSLLLASEALEALGDAYAILSFSGLGRHDVRVATVKGFTEHDGAAVHRRISSLAPQDNTRLGAAVRHGTALLALQPAARRVLLILSDGRPNDVDRYQGIDAIEDSRHAVLAARARGIHTFCLTVDTEEADYLPRLFGEGGYQVISQPGQLPAALIRLVDRLLRG
jgi:nitric oxide reductase NorD protein